MLTEKDYCDYETCVALKELGYKVPASAYYMPNNNQLIFVSNPCRGGYVIDCFHSHNSLREDVMTHDFIDAPTMQEAQKWLREEKGMHIEINLQFLSEEKRWYWGFTIIYFDNPHLVSINGDYSSYEETLSEGIKEAVKILKNNGKAN